VKADHDADRRHFVRAVVAAPTAIRARVRPGRDVRLIDYSRGGALVQSTSRLLPGSHVELQLSTGQWQWSCTAQVIRAQVWALVLEEHVRYRVAVQFVRPMDTGTLDEIHDALRQDGGDGPAGYAIPTAGSIDPG
jgi:hypothetical protein